MSKEVDPKIETLFKAFDEFIEKYHNNSDNNNAQDKEVVNNWNKFKKIIEYDPMNL